MAEQTNGIKNKLSQIEQVVASSLRPLPTETGDGTYIKSDTKTGISKDLEHLNLKDVKTVVELAKDAVTGAAWNDRDYIMERLIQVCISKVELTLEETKYIIGYC